MAPNDSNIEYSTRWKYCGIRTSMRLYYHELPKDNVEKGLTYKSSVCNMGSRRVQLGSEATMQYSVVEVSPNRSSNV